MLSRIRSSFWVSSLDFALSVWIWYNQRIRFERILARKYVPYNVPLTMYRLKRWNSLQYYIFNAISKGTMLFPQPLAYTHIFEFEKRGRHSVFGIKRVVVDSEVTYTLRIKEFYTWMRSQSNAHGWNDDAKVHLQIEYVKGWYSNIRESYHACELVIWMVLLLILVMVVRQLIVYAHGVIQ